jgi:integrase
MNIVVSKSAVDLLVEAYQQHLTQVAGLQPSSGQRYAFFVRLFLKAQFKPKARALDLRQLTPEVLLDFVLEQSRRYPPEQLQCLASALRSFCRFLCVTGRHGQDLSAALLPISGHHQEHLPTYLSPRQLERVLDVFDRRTVLGKRDYAMTLCLARLGLRAGEVARLTLDDLDWRHGQLRLAAPKGRRERRLPLPGEVGQALAAYLRIAGSAGPSRALFRPVGGRGPMSAAWLSRRVGAALARAGLGAPGQRAHLLRRTLATHLVQQGVSLKAVADLLGHASLSTTQVYTKVNLPMLRAVAQPWPGEVRP